MKRRHRLLTLLLLAALLLSVAQPLIAQESPPAPEPHGLRADAPPYAIHGPYAVGVRNFEIDATKENERPLTVTVWYPALNPQGVKESITYEMGFPAGETPNVSIFGQASENAQPAVDGAPYPLIVHTHGHWSFRQESAYLDEHLASMGFVVISADHEDNWSTLFGPKAWQSEFRRPNEVTREIDYAEKLGADGGPLAGIVDTGRVGVFGWSFGGETALVAGGARLDLGKMRAWCEENKVDGIFPDTDCVDILDHEAELAVLAGLNETPQGLWPDWSDERVDAVIGLAPWVGSLSEASLQTLTIPTLLMIGSTDTAAGPTYRPFQPYQKIAAERKAEVVFENADHFLYFSLCRDVPEIVALGLEIFCTDPVWDMDRAHDLINHFATAFLLAELKGDAEAATALAAENTAFTGVQYQESGYSEAPAIDPAAEPQGLRPDAPTYGVRGMYPVGAREFSVEAGDQTVNITVWYPALNLGNVKEEITYAIGANVPDMASLPVSGRAIANATPYTAEGPYPLVIFSPGLAGWSQANSYLLEHLTSYGFVVIASDPRGETFAEFWAGAGTRPVDIRLTIDYADKLTAADGTLAGLIDTDHIAVAGHSSGGWTALVGGGAQMDFSWCAANPDIVAENELSNCTQFVPHADQIAAILGLESTPDTLWPPMNDQRVDAVVALAPDGDIWGAEFEGVAALKVPTLVMAGSGDTVNIPERCAYPIYEHLGSANKSLVVFANADHMVFFNQCRDTPWMLPATFWACSDAVWDMDRGHDLINHFATAFLLTELKGDAEAATALAAENVSFPGITYETTGYGAAGEAAPESGLDDATIAKIEALVEETMTRINLPGFALAVVKDGNLAYAKGFGVTSLDGDEPVTPQTVFQWAETSMALTAMAVMQLAEEGKLDLDAPITEYIPYFKLQDERGKEITTRHLLTHSSGIPDSGDAMADWETFMPQYDAGATERWIRAGLAETGLLSAPGTGFEYSDIAYALLGAVVGAASGQPYEEYMSEHILAPLGMDQSAFLLEDVDKTQLAKPHVPDAAGELVASEAQPYHRPFAGANNLFSTIEDMAKLAQANLNRGELNGQRILPESAYDLMWAPYSPTPYAEFPFGQVHPANLLLDWGYGWFLGEAAGQRVPSILGGEHGYSAQIDLAPDANIAVLAIGNAQAMSEFYASDMATDVLGMLLEK